MSVECLHDTWTNSPLTDGELLVQLAIADLVNKQNDYLYWGGYEYLAIKTKKSVDTVKRAIRSMKELGILKDVGFTTRSKFKTFQYILKVTKQKPQKTVVVDKDTEQKVRPLCDLLADKIQHHTSERPLVTSAWLNDMRLLLVNGPLGVESNGKSEAEIKELICQIFTQLNRRRNGFCWADQITSPKKLRQHYSKVFPLVRNLDNTIADILRSVS